MTAPRLSLLISLSDHAVPEPAVIEAVTQFLARHPHGAEAILAFDGHRGREAATFREHAAGVEGLRVVELHQNMGESATLAAAVKAAEGTLLIRVPPFAQVEWDALDAVARELEAGADCVLVRRVDTQGREGGGFQRKLHNQVVSRIARMEVHDVGCQMAGFTAEVARALPMHGNLHRYLPVLVGLEGFSTTHLAVRAQSPASSGEKRRSPRSYLARSLDFLAVLFLARSTGSPLRFFGLLGIGPMLVGTLLTLWLVVERFTQGVPLAGRPLLLLGLLLITAGIQFLAIGFLGELMVYLHYRDRNPDRARELFSAAQRHDVDSHRRP